MTTAFTARIIGPGRFGATVRSGFGPEQPADVTDVEDRRRVVLEDPDGEEDPTDRGGRLRERESEVPPRDQRHRRHQHERADLPDVPHVDTATSRPKQG